MEFKSRVVQDFKQKIEIISRNQTSSSSFNYSKNLERSNSTIIRPRPFSKTKEEAFVPKNMIICLVIRKVVLAKLVKLSNFAFCLIRSLFKEWKIKNSPKKKHFRSASFSIKPYLKKNYLKKSQEKSILAVFQMNKNKIFVNKCFFMWNQVYRRRVSLKSRALGRFLEFIHHRVLISKKNVWVLIEKNKDLRIRYIKFLKDVQRGIKKRVFKYLFKPSIKIISTSIKVFKPLMLPRQCFPVFINQTRASFKTEPFNNFGSKTSIKRKNFQKGLLILNNSKGIKQLFLKRALINMRNHSWTMCINDKLKSSEIFFSCFEKIQVKDLKSTFATIKKTASIKLIQELHLKKGRKFTSTIESIILPHQKKLKIFAFLKLFLFFTYFRSIRMIKKGLQKISNALSYKIMNRIYYGFLAISSHVPKRLLYRDQIKKHPLIFKSLSNMFNRKFIIKKRIAFKDVCSYIFSLKIFDFCFLIGSFEKSRIKYMKGFAFAELKKADFYYMNKFYFKFTRFCYMMKKVYLKHIAYAFLNWENKKNLSKIWTSSSSPFQKKQTTRRTNSSSSYESKIYSTPNKNSRILPRPKSIHDYIDDFIESSKTCLNTSYY